MKLRSINGGGIRQEKELKSFRPSKTNRKERFSIIWIKKIDIKTFYFQQQMNLEVIHQD